MKNDYYKNGNLECRNVIKAWGLGFNLGNVLKYICRAGKKTEDPADDLIKAIHYLLFELEDQGPLSSEQRQKLYKIEVNYWNREWSLDNSDTP